MAHADSVDSPLNTLNQNDITSVSPSSCLIDQLHRAVNCGDPSCCDLDCLIGQELLKHLDESFGNVKDGLKELDPVASFILCSISEHAESCDEMRCSIPHCSSFFHLSEFPIEVQIQRFLAKYMTEEIHLTNISQINTKSENVVYKSLMDRLPPGPLLENHDWIPVERFGTFSDVVLASPTIPLPSYWVVKKCKSNSIHYMDLLSDLRYNCHSSIANHIWALKYTDSLYIAMEFEGKSLKTIFDENNTQNGLPLPLVWMYLRQLVDALEFLHSLGIVYLSWKASNIILTANKEQVKLADFSSAVRYKSIEDNDDEIEDIALMLPPIIVPPELYKGELSPASDIWGLACIIHHITTGQTVHHIYRHQDYASLRDTLQSDDLVVPELTHTGIEDCAIKQLLQQSFQVLPSDRVLLSHIKNAAESYLNNMPAE